MLSVPGETLLKSRYSITKSVHSLLFKVAVIGSWVSNYMSLAAKPTTLTSLCLLTFAARFFPSETGSVVDDTLARLAQRKK